MLIAIQIRINRSYINWTCQIVTFSIFVLNRKLYRFAAQKKISYSTMCLNIKHRRRWHPKPLATNNFFKHTHTHTFSIETLFLPRKKKEEKCTVWKAFSARVVERTTSIYLSAENILWAKSLYLILNVLNGKCRICHAIWDRYECLKYFLCSLNKNPAPLRWNAERTTDQLPD